MTIMQQLLHLAILIAVIPIISASICHSQHLFITSDFEVSCTKSRTIEVEILCLNSNPSSWLQFPKEKIYLSNISLLIKNCTLPSTLKLFEIVNSLGVEHLTMLQLSNLHSGCHRSNFQNLSLDTLEFKDSSFEELPSDLLYSLNPINFYITGAKLKEVPDEFFEKSVGLKSMEIVNTQMSILKKEDFSKLINLESLLLFGNSIDQIEIGTFDHLVNLRTLDLSKNNLKTLPDDVFRNLIKLEILNLSENEFDYIPNDLLMVENSQLQKFRLNRNRGLLEELPSSFFKNLSNLNYVELTSNNFKRIPEDVFLGAEGLHTVNISNNSFSVLPVGLFKNKYGLMELWLEQNKLINLPDGIFDETDLEILYLDYNRLSNLTE